MDVSLIKRVIADQRADLKKKFESERIIKREFIDEIGRVFKQHGLLVLSGIRRSGKSVASVLLSGHDYGYVNFDDPSLAGLKSGDLIYVKEAMVGVWGDPPTLILDEVQNVSGWELFVSRLRETKRTIITGSNASLLSGELGTRLTGRYIKFSVMPFSFREFLEYRRADIGGPVYTTSNIAEIKGQLEVYLKQGGFPEANIYGQRIVAQIYEDIITKDIEKRYGIRYRSTFREFARYVLSNSAGRISYNSLKNAFDIKSVHTAKNYLAYLQNAYLVMTINRYSRKLKEQGRSAKKVYCADNGILNALGFRVVDDKPRLLENLVAIELLRRSSYWRPGLEVYYWQDALQREVDFVLKNGERAEELMQVTYELNASNMSRELTPLLKASDELRCNKLTVLTWEDERVVRKRGKRISIIPIWRWLLNQGGV
jgi:predicted AAA+ superfamily ATPase